MFFLPPVYPIVNIGTVLDPIAHFAALLRAGATLIQLRAKGRTRAEVIELASALLRTRRELGLSSAQARLLVNDDPEVCRECGADGVHLGQGDLSPLLAREILGPQAVIGFSTHNFEQVRAAPVAALNYLAMGPVFPSLTKSGHAPLVPLEVLRQAAEHSALPLVAIGGITAENCREVYLAGAKSVAVIGDLQGCGDLSAKLAAYGA